MHPFWSGTTYVNVELMNLDTNIKLNIAEVLGIHLLDNEDPIHTL